MKLITQVTAAIIIFAVLLVFLSGFVISTDRQVNSLSRQQEIANSIAIETGELGYLSNDYIIHREPQLADRWNAKCASIAGNLARLSVDQPEQQAIADNLAANLHRIRLVFDDIGADPLPRDGAGTGFVDLSWGRIAVLNQGMIFDANRLAGLIRDQENGVRNTRLYLILGLMGAFGALLVTGYFFVYRRMIRSLDKIRQGATIIGTGDFHHLIKESSDDEIGDLARSFNRMTAELREVTASKADLEREMAGRKMAEEHLIRKNKDLNAANEELTAIQEELRQNVDELTGTEKNLRESEEKFRVLFTQMVEGSALHEIVYSSSGDPVDYRILDINPSFERILGLKREDVIGKNSTEAYGVDAPPYFEIYIQVAETGHSEEFEVFFAPMKKHFAVSVYSPEPGKFATIFVDITERKGAEEKVRDLLLEVQREKDRLSSLINSISDEVWYTDNQKNFTLANPAAVREFALGIDVVDGEKFAASLEVYRTDGTPRPVEEAPSLRALKGEEVRNLEEVIRTPGKGELRYRQVSANPVRDASGNIIGSVSVVRDITDLIKAEEELKRQNIDLNALNEELTATHEELHQNIDDLNRNEEILRQHEDELKQALAEKEVLLSEIHHRVKNNLTAFISLLSLEGSIEDTPEGKRLKQDLRNRARSMALIHETLYKTHKFDEVDMKEYLTSLIGQVASTNPSPQPCRTLIEVEEISLDINRATPMGLVINELLTNSLKYAFPVGDTASTRGRENPCLISVRFSRDDGSYVLQVADNGVGLPPGFEIEKTRTLGLKLVNFLARYQLRATVDVKTVKGTEFIFRFRDTPV